jgi:hypothetical protein
VKVPKKKVPPKKQPKKTAPVYKLGNSQTTMLVSKATRNNANPTAGEIYEQNEYLRQEMVNAAHDILNGKIAGRRNKQSIETQTTSNPVMPISNKQLKKVPYEMNRASPYSSTGKTHQPFKSSSAHPSLSSNHPFKSSSDSTQPEGAMVVYTGPKRREIFNPNKNALRTSTNLNEYLNRQKINKILRPPIEPPLTSTELVVHNKTPAVATVINPHPDNAEPINAKKSNGGRTFGSLNKTNPNHPDNKARALAGLPLVLTAKQQKILENTQKVKTMKEQQAKGNFDYESYPALVRSDLDAIADREMARSGVFENSNPEVMSVGSITRSRSV